MKTYGRQTIYTSYTEEDLLEASRKVQNERIIEILENSAGIHQTNRTQTIYLQDFLKGIQDVYVEKVKKTRPEIDNKQVENWAWAMVDFKKCYLLGKPIQYVQLNDDGEKEIALLNKYLRLAGKKAKDMNTYEDILTCGRAFVYKSPRKVTDDNEAPFEILNCDVENTEVVYSSKLGRKQVGSYIVTPMLQNVIVTLEDGTRQNTLQRYNEYTFYLRNRAVTLNDKNGKLVVTDSKPIIMNEHSITEYYTNRQRMSLVEIGKDLFNAINNLESLDADDMEQFVNALLIFTNVEMSESDLVDLRKLGAMSISSTEQKKASVELLGQRLSSTDTQTYYTRLLTALHQILGIPMASDNGNVTYGDTGKARLTGQGYLSAGIRAEGDETMFGERDMEMLRGVLKACKLSNSSEIKELNVSDFEPKFNRDKSENILTKTQALQNLISVDIPRKFANEIVGLFGDANAITKEQERLFGEQVSQLNQPTGYDSVNADESDNTNTNDLADEQENNMTNVLERDNQGQ